MHIYPARFATVFAVEMCRYYVHRLYAHAGATSHRIAYEAAGCRQLYIPTHANGFRIRLYIHYFELGELTSGRVHFIRPLYRDHSIEMILRK